MVRFGSMNCEIYLSKHVIFVRYKRAFQGKNQVSNQDYGASRAILLMCEEACGVALSLASQTYKQSRLDKVRNFRFYGVC